MKASARVYLAATVLSLAMSAAAAADAFPNRPIHIIVNAGAGGILDAQTRMVAQEMAKDLGQPVIIENRVGADGLIGIRYVKGVPADGYTILASANTFAQNPALKGDTGYEIRDFMGVGMIASGPLLMVTAPSNPEHTVTDLIANARSNPGKLTYASGGVGTSSHMAAALFISQAGVRMLHVPYKGNAAGQPDVMAGRININFNGADVISHVREGRLRALAVTSSKRSPAFPEIPTLAEQGLPNYEFLAYSGLYVPAATPREVVQRLSQSLRAALDTPAVRDRLRREAQDGGTMSPDEFMTFVRNEAVRVAKVARELNLSKD